MLGARSFRNSSTLAYKIKQEESLDQDKCIEIDSNDLLIGCKSKRDCHKVDKNGNIVLHRAFSVFLFNEEGDMLIQRRSKSKVFFRELF